MINTTLVAETKIALVIGNSKYEKWGELKNPKNDAEDMKNLLESRGFDVLYGVNLKKYEFEELLIKFRKKLTKNKKSVGLFYFSGHGMEIEHNNYLIPIDSKEPKRYLNISLDSIIDDMSRANERLNIIILDACRDNPFILNFSKSYNRGGFIEIEPTQGLLIAYATQAGRIASDGEGLKNGLFTKYLLKYMKEPLPLYSVFRKTRDAVYKNSKGTQRPTINDQIIGDNFFFTQPKIKKVKKSTNSASTISYIPLYCDYQDNDFD